MGFTITMANAGERVQARGGFYYAMEEVGGVANVQKSVSYQDIHNHTGHCRKRLSSLSSTWILTIFPR